MPQKNPRMKRDHGQFFSLDQWVENRTIHYKYVLPTEKEMKEAFRAMRKLDDIDEQGLPSCGQKNDMLVFLMSDIDCDGFTDREDALIQNWIYKRAEAVRGQREDHVEATSAGLEALAELLEG